MIGNVRVQKVANIVANSLLIEIIDIGWLCEMSPESSPIKKLKIERVWF